jgi:hypothetical protein
MKKNTYLWLALGVAGIAAAWLIVYMVRKNRNQYSATNYASGELDPVPNPMSGASGASVGAAAGIGLEAASAAQVGAMLSIQPTK